MSKPIERERKRPGPAPKYAPGTAPWEIEGIPETTWRHRERRARRAREAAEAHASGNVVTVAKRVSPEPLGRPVTPPMVYQRPAGNEALAGVVNVAIRASRAQHDRLRDLAHATRSSIQAIVSQAIDEFLARNPIKAP